MDSDTGAELHARHRECARLDLSGMTVTEIAQSMGIARQTVYNWQRLPAYIAHIAQLHTDLDRATVHRVRGMRGESLRLLGMAHAEVDARLSGDASMTTAELVGVMRAVLDLYRVTAGQTGIEETMRHEHSGKVDTTMQVVVSSDLAERIERGEFDDEETGAIG